MLMSSKVTSDLHPECSEPVGLSRQEHCGWGPAGDGMVTSLSLYSVLLGGPVVRGPDSLGSPLHWLPPPTYPGLLHSGKIIKHRSPKIKNTYVKAKNLSFYPAAWATSFLPSLLPNFQNKCPTNIRRLLFPPPTHHEPTTIWLPPPGSMEEKLCQARPPNALPPSLSPTGTDPPCLPHTGGIWPR